MLEEDLCTQKKLLSQKNERALPFRDSALLWGTDFLKPETLIGAKVRESDMHSSIAGCEVLPDQSY